MSKDRIADFNQADKPEWVKTQHVAVMNIILHLRLPSNISQTSIAKRAGCSQATVSNAFIDIVDHKWIDAKSGARRQATNWIKEILYENLPAYVPMPELVVSEFALRMADWYHRNFVATWSKYENSRGHHCTKKAPKDWKQRWSIVFQLRMNQGYTEQELEDRLNLVGINKNYAKDLRVGPQNRRLFPIKKEVVK